MLFQTTIPDEQESPVGVPVEAELAVHIASDLRLDDVPGGFPLPVGNVVNPLVVLDTARNAGVNGIRQFKFWAVIVDLAAPTPLW